MARVLRRGDIVWADLRPTQGREQAGKRPILILSKDIFNTHSQTVIAMAITSKEPKVGFPFTLKLDRVRMPKPSWVKISQIRTLDIVRLGDRIAGCPNDIMKKIILGLNQIISEDRIP